MNILKSIISVAFIGILAGCSGNQTDDSVLKASGSEVSGDSAAEIHFDQTEHDLGRILQGETVGYNFSFTNVGGSPLIIENAQAGCGCTVPRYSREPIPPGESGVIEVVFDSSGRIGQQIKTVSIHTNSGESVVTLIITADIYGPQT